MWWADLSISYPKPDLYNINAQSWVKIYRYLLRLSYRNKYMDRAKDDQCELRHNHLVGYKNKVQMGLICTHDQIICSDRQV